MLARVAHDGGARVLLDNTWGFGIFMPFTHGVDVSIQALTKYPGGHSDAILGAITVGSEEDWHMLRDAAIDRGCRQMLRSSAFPGGTIVSMNVRTATEQVLCHS